MQEAFGRFFRFPQHLPFALRNERTNRFSKSARARRPSAAEKGWGGMRSSWDETSQVLV